MNLKRMLPFMGLTAMLFVSSCTNEDDYSTWRTKQGVNFTSQITEASRATVDNTWTAGDEIGIFRTTAGSGLAEATEKNVKYTAAPDGTLTPAGDPIYHPATGASDFVAYYPYQANLTGSSVSVDVTKQTEPTKIDLLYSNNSTNVAAGKNVNLVFKHQLTQIVLNITADATITSTAGLTMSLGNVPTTATLELATGVLTAGTTMGTIQMNVTADGTKAVAILVPQATGEGRVLTFTLGGKTYAYTFPVNTAFEGGTKHVYNVKMAVDNNTQKLTVSFQGASITDWVEKPGDDITVTFPGEEQPTPDPTTPKVLFSAPFQSGVDGFTEDYFNKATAISAVWTHAVYKEVGYMKASAFLNNVKYATESRLVSPEIDLTTATAPVLAFEHTAKFFGTFANECKVQVREIGADSWTDLTIPTQPTGKDWTYVQSGDIDLSVYKGKKVQIALYYKSTAENAGTWQVRKLTITDGASGTTPAPEEPKPTPEEPKPNPVEPTPTPNPTEQTIFLETMGEGDYSQKRPKVADFTDWSAKGNTYEDLASVKKVDVRSTSTLNPNLWFPAKGAGNLKISGFDTTGYTELLLTFDMAGNKAGMTSPLKVFADDKEVTYPATALTGDNKYVSVSVAIPTGTKTLRFMSDATANSQGTRLDNIKLTGKK